VPDQNPNDECGQREQADSDPQPSIQNEGGSEDQEAKSKGRPHYLHKVLKWLAIVIAAPGRWAYSLAPIEKFTAVLCVIGGVQLWAFVQSERAYLTFTNFNFIGGLTANRSLTLLFNAKNSGKSAAEIRNISVTTIATSTGLTYPLKYDKLLEIATNPIEAGATSSQIYVGKNIDGSLFVMHPITVADIAAGRAKLFVYGFADYEDDFSIFGSHRTHFCYLYLPERSAPGNAAFGGCPITQQH
jgi:hypothetical protein